MIAIILATINNLIWTGVDIWRKQMRRKNANAISILTTSIFIIPLWILSLLILANNYNFILSRQYLWYISGRAILTITTSIWAIFFYKFQTLSEYNTYSLTFWAILWWIVDCYFFGTSFHIETIVWVIFLFIAWLIISNNKESIEKTKKHKMKLWQIILNIILLSSIGILETALYKKWVNIQIHPIIHWMFSQIIVFSIIGIIGWKALKKDIEQKTIWINEITIQWILIFIYTLIEPFILKGLPIVVLRSLSSLRLILFAIYDMKKNEFKSKWNLIFSLFLAIIGIVLISI